ncbi:type II toxin-antitoxin system VapC family toxin [Caulobacter sp. BK020]|uniref:type II toxin-antitoxin system VapC family toxin n=1 Tax=Caulobacter sp. BK020 TaxID=2512117 RepID=UPI0010EED531|nr:type II toxin-antitoxin system VapC family toxin [Caulobacter sp. BK020]TCS07498.1 putative nucleic acid-binding protein [Caulobacter sp. BK020]
MTLVVDASVALKWVLAEPGQAAADALLDEDLIAPSLWLLEAANALWRRSLSGELSAGEADERLSELFNAPVTSVPIEDDLSAAAALAWRLGHPVYDCLYLALAVREHSQVVTADRRFWAAVQAVPELVDKVRLLGD